MCRILSWMRNISDILLRPVKFVKGGLAQAAVGIEDNDSGELSLYTESGALLGPGRNAATGLGRTICTDYYIAFGGGRFIASDPETTNKVMRGSLDEDGNFVWAPAVFTAGGQTIAGISYCGGYFFVTSRTNNEDGSRTCYIARGASGGTLWSETTFLDGSGSCGSVACKPDGVRPDGTPKTLYCSVGEGAGDDPNYAVLYSATSNNGLSWSTNVSSNPASASDVAAGKDVFVTGGFDFSIVTVGGFSQGTAAAQANWSSTKEAGGRRSDQPVPGGTADAATFCETVVFVNPGGGYFIALTGESAENSVYVLKSASGRGGWTIIGHYTGSDPDSGASVAGLSVIGKNIGTIVKI